MVTKNNQKSPKNVYDNDSAGNPMDQDIPNYICYILEHLKQAQ